MSSLLKVYSKQFEKCDEECGWGSIKPPGCQNMRSIKLMLLFLCLSGFMQVGFCLFVINIRPSLPSSHPPSNHPGHPYCYVCCLSVYLSVSISLPPSPSLPPRLSVSPPLRLSPSPPLPLSVSASASPSLNLSLSLSLLQKLTAKLNTSNNFD